MSGRQIDWTRPLVTSHNPPRVVSLRADEKYTTRKRVAVPERNRKPSEKWEDVPSTTWLYDERGYCRKYSNDAPNDNDLQYADALATNPQTGEG